MHESLGRMGPLNSARSVSHAFIFIQFVVTSWETCPLLTFCVKFANKLNRKNVTILVLQYTVVKSSTSAYLLLFFLLWGRLTGWQHVLLKGSIVIITEGFITHISHNIKTACHCRQGRSNPSRQGHRACGVWRILWVLWVARRGIHGADLFLRMLNCIKIWGVGTLSAFSCSLSHSWTFFTVWQAPMSWKHIAYSSIHEHLLLSKHDSVC